MNQQESKSANVEISKSKEDKAARTGLIDGIGAVILVPPFAYFGAGLLYWLFNGVGGPGFCSLPLCLFPIGLIIAAILSSMKGRKSSRKSIATVGLVLSILAIILGIVAAIFGFIDATKSGGII